MLFNKRVIIAFWHIWDWKLPIEIELHFDICSPSLFFLSYLIHLKFKSIPQPGWALTTVQHGFWDSTSRDNFSFFLAGHDRYRGKQSCLCGVNQKSRYEVSLKLIDIVPTSFKTWKFSLHKNLKIYNWWEENSFSWKEQETLRGIKPKRKMEPL